LSKDYYYDPITKDIVLTSLKDLRFTQDIVEYTTQKIERKLSFMLGEWYLNVTVGLPYLAQNNNDRDDNTKNILVKNPNIPWINNQFILQLDEIDTIDRIISFSSELDTNLRKFNIDFEVSLINGETLSDSLQIGVF
jgi:hypothetical protein